MTSSERLQIQVTKVVMLLVWGVGEWVWGMEAVRYVLAFRKADRRRMGGPAYPA